MVEITHYDEADNPLRERIIDLMVEYDDEFSDFKTKLSEHAKKSLFESQDLRKKVDTREAIELFYNDSFNHIVIALDTDESGEESVVGIKIVDTITETDSELLDVAPEFYPCMRYTYELIKEDYRGQGIYTDMLEYTEQNLLDKHPDHNSAAYFLTSESNAAMKNAGQSNGFEEVAVLQDDRRTGENTAVYVKLYSEFRTLDSEEDDMHERLQKQFAKITQRIGKKP